MSARTCVRDTNAIRVLFLGRWEETDAVDGVCRHSGHLDQVEKSKRREVEAGMVEEKNDHLIANNCRLRLSWKLACCCRCFFNV